MSAAQQRLTDVAADESCSACYQYAHHTVLSFTAVVRVTPLDGSAARRGSLPAARYSNASTIATDESSPASAAIDDVHDLRRRTVHACRGQRLVHRRVARHRHLGPHSRERLRDGGGGSLRLVRRLRPHRNAEELRVTKRVCGDPRRQVVRARRQARVMHGACRDGAALRHLRVRRDQPVQLPRALRGVGVQRGVREGWQRREERRRGGVRRSRLRRTVQARHHAVGRKAEQRAESQQPPPAPHHREDPRDIHAHPPSSGAAVRAAISRFFHQRLIFRVRWVPAP